MQQTCLPDWLASKYICTHTMDIFRKGGIMLSEKEKRIAAIGAYTAVSDVGYLVKECRAALATGLTVNEMKEIFLQLCAYCGFPRGLQAINIFMAVLEEAGGKVEMGRTPSPISDSRSKYERGEKVQCAVTGWTKEELRSGAMGFIPKIDCMLKEYIFADIYESDVLSYAEREIATLGAQLSMDGIEPMIEAHINAGLNVGLSAEKIDGIIKTVELAFGRAKGDRGRKLLANVLSRKNN